MSVCAISEGRQYRRVWIHAGGLAGEDNQLLTMISRGMGSPWDGAIKIDGIRLDPWGGEQKELKKRMAPYGKSLLIAKLLGKDVEQTKYDAMRNKVLAVDPNWLRVEAAIQGRVL